jgi:Ca2+-binding EF-hand superfamily protein
LKDLKRVSRELGDFRTDEELREMIKEADLDKDGLVNEEEFLKIIRRRTKILE